MPKRKLLSPGRTKWDEAISDAKQKIKALKVTIAVYRQRKKAGELWPGDYSGSRPTKLFLGLTKDCMDRILAGQVEHIEVGDNVELVIRYSEKLPSDAVGVRGPGMYLFTDREK